MNYIKDSKNGITVPWKKAVILYVPPERLSKFLHDTFQESYPSFTKFCKTFTQSQMTVVDCSEVELLEILTTQLDGESGKQHFKMVPAFLSIQNSTVKERDTDLNRFSDNDELRYSLRSLEKYMPWVRKIFVVTNGQIPAWMNLFHPRLTIVTHEEIYPNAKHLPTFSSGSIETHIHRIEGLSEHFLYFNDDFLLGEPVGPEDFYTPSSGYKIYLSWSLPECSPGCLATWIKDDFCDDACNTAECDYDGGDCLDQKQQDEQEQITEDDQCSPLCLDSWLADSYCDLACKTMICGFDAGDCGIEVLKTGLQKVNLPPVDDTIVIPRGHIAVWIDLSSLVQKQGDRVTGSYPGSSKGIRLMSIGKPSAIATLILRPNRTATTRITLELFRADASFMKISFNVSYNTYTDSPTEGRPQAPKKLGLIPHNLSSMGLQPRIDYHVRNAHPANISEQLLQIARQYKNQELTKKGYDLKLASLTGRRNITNSRPPAADAGPTLSNFTGKFAWEKQLTLEIRDTLEANKSLSQGKRKLLDIFGESLLYVNHIYNDAYGIQARKVPAHLPYFLNKSIIAELQYRYPEEFLLTSGHQFRRANDMQLSFSYFYFLMSEHVERTTEDIFDIIDTDLSGTWADREIRTFLALTGQLPIEYSDLQEVQHSLRNCSASLRLLDVSAPPYDRYPDSELPTISKELITRCEDNVLETRINSMKNHSKYKFKTVQEPAWHFKMISSNVSNVVSALDDIRKHPRKFICLNNDMDPRSADNDIVQALLIDFFEAKYPIKSSFELPSSYRNRFLHTTQLHQWKWQRKLTRALIYASLCSLLIFTIGSLFGTQISAIKRRWCRRVLNERTFTTGRV